MRIFKNIAYISLLFILSSCGSDVAYWNALPEQAAAVASVDVSRLSMRAGIDEDNSGTGVGRLKEMVKSGIEGSGQLVDKIFTDASETGISFKDKIYIFSSDENAILGLLAKVISRNKLEDVLHLLTKEQLCLPVVETDGCNWTVLGKWLVAYSDDAMLVLTDNKWADPTKLVRQASMWLRQGEGRGFAAKDDFQRLQSTKADLTLWTSLQLLPRNIITPLTMGLSAEIDLKKVKAITTFNFESGKTIIDIDPIVTDRIVKDLMDKKMQAMAPINGSHLDLFPSKTQFWSTAHVKGHEFYQFMNSIPAVRKFFEHSELPIALDWGRIFEAIDGDVSFTITDGFRREYILWADVKQTEFLQFFTELKPMIAKTNGLLLFEERGKDAYCFATHDGSVMNLRPGAKIFWLGVKDGRFYVTNKEELINQRVLGLSLRNKEWGNRVSGMNFFAVSDWNSLLTFEYFMQKDVLKQLPANFPGLINTIIIESKDGQHIKCTIQQTNKKQNLIQILFHL